MTGNHILTDENSPSEEFFDAQEDVPSHGPLLISNLEQESFQDVIQIQNIRVPCEHYNDQRFVSDLGQVAEVKESESQSVEIQPEVGDNEVFQDALDSDVNLIPFDTTKKHQNSHDSLHENLESDIVNDNTFGSLRDSNKLDISNGLNNEVLRTQTSDSESKADFGFNLEGEVQIANQGHLEYPEIPSSSLQSSSHDTLKNVDSSGLDKKPPMGPSQHKNTSSINQKPPVVRHLAEFVPLSSRPGSNLKEETRQIVMMLENDKAFKVPRPHLGLQDRLKSLMNHSSGKKSSYMKGPRFCNTFVKSIAKCSNENVGTRRDSFKEFIKQRKGSSRKKSIQNAISSSSYLKNYKTNKSLTTEKRDLGMDENVEKVTHNKENGVFLSTFTSSLQTNNGDKISLQTNHASEDVKANKSDTSYKNAINCVNSSIPEKNVGIESSGDAILTSSQVSRESSIDNSTSRANDALSKSNEIHSCIIPDKWYSNSINDNFYNETYYKKEPQSNEDDLSCNDNVGHNNCQKMLVENYEMNESQKVDNNVGSCITKNKGIKKDYKSDDNDIDIISILDPYQCQQYGENEKDVGSRNDKTLVITDMLTEEFKWNEPETVSSFQPVECDEVYFQSIDDHPLSSSIYNGNDITQPSSANQDTSIHQTDEGHLNERVVECDMFAFINHDQNQSTEDDIISIQTVDESWENNQSHHQDPVNDCIAPLDIQVQPASDESSLSHSSAADQFVTDKSELDLGSDGEFSEDNTKCENFSQKSDTEILPNNISPSNIHMNEFNKGNKKNKANRVSHPTRQIENSLTNTDLKKHIASLNKVSKDLVKKQADKRPDKEMGINNASTCKLSKKESTGDLHTQNTNIPKISNNLQEINVDDTSDNIGNQDFLSEKRSKDITNIPSADRGCASRIIMEADITQLKTDNLVARHRGARFKYHLTSESKQSVKVKSKSNSEYQIKHTSEKANKIKSDESDILVTNENETSQGKISKSYQPPTAEVVSDNNQQTNEIEVTEMRIDSHKRKHIRSRYSSVDYHRLCQSKSRRATMIKRHHSCIPDAQKSSLLFGSNISDKIGNIKNNFSQGMLKRCLEFAIDQCVSMGWERKEVSPECKWEISESASLQKLNKALVRAVTKHNAEKVRELLMLGADANINCGHTPVLLRAAKGGALYVVQALEAAGADIDARLASGDSALHVAAKGGHSEIIIHLVHSGAHVDAINRNGVTPLQVALAYGHLEVAQMLLRLRADILAQNKVGETALEIANYLGYIGLTGRPKELRRDSAPGTRVEAPPTSIPIAVKMIQGIEEGCAATVENCLALGAAPNTLVPLALHWPARATVLHRAAHHGEDIITRLLLRGGADINMKDDVGNTPLHAAAQAGHNKVVKILLSNGAQLESVSQSGMTPLHRASSKGKDLTCNLLLRRGANPKAEDGSGYTPADWARKRGFKSLARKLFHRRRSSTSLIAEENHNQQLRHLNRLHQAALSAGQMMDDMDCEE